jgi:predicted transglutaminase-like cysteine proteinase
MFITDYLMLIKRLRWRHLHAELATALCLVLVFGAAALDVKNIISLAEQHYGGRAAQVLTQWSELRTSTQGMADDELLQTVNNFVNRRIAYQEDTQAWGVADYWATPLESMGRGVGDCEDYVIAKYVTLVELGIPNNKLRLIYVRARLGSSASSPSQAHMVLGYFENPEDEPLILDNLIGSIRPAASRKDLSPVFSFNSDGLWAGVGNETRGDPTARLSLWRGVLQRMQQEGFTLTSEVPARKQ